MPGLILYAVCMFFHQPDAKPAEGYRPGTHVVKLQVAGRERRYLVRVPPAHEGQTKLPAVLIFHGAGGTARLYLDKNGWEKEADAGGFLAVAPDGTPPLLGQPSNFKTNPQLWNDGSGRPGMGRAGDDVAFVSALLDDLEKRFAVDPKRLYATGHSNGAGLSFLLGTKLSRRLAAIAPVMSHCWQDEPKPERPIPTLFIVGMKDPLVPFAGGEVPSPWNPAKKDVKPAIADSVKKWRLALGIAGEPTVSRDDEKVRIEEHGPGQDGAAFRVALLKRQGHGWPAGHESGLPASLIGPLTQDYDATAEIWKFFKEQRLP